MANDIEKENFCAFIEFALKYFTIRELAVACDTSLPTIRRYRERKSAPIGALKAMMIRFIMAEFYKKYNKET